MNALHRFMAATDLSTHKRLARLAKTTLGHLHQLKGGHRKPSAELAIALERAADILRKRGPELPELRREELSVACKGCEFARRCRSEA